MIRKTISLTALLSFILLMLTSIILYIVPAGRVAYWADYHLWGLTKTTWGDLHINLGFLFFVTILIHTYLNWKAITTYMKNKTKDLRVFTVEFNLALIITLAFSVGTLYEVPPFSSILQLGEKISAEANAFYGEPPYGHAELSSLQTFSNKMGLDLAQSMNRLNNSGISFENSGQTLKEIAYLNNLSPNDIYLVISPLPERIKTFPKEPPAGLGKRPLIDLCQEYSVNIKSVLSILTNNDIEAMETMSIRAIANLAGKDPFATYELIRSQL
ncbi:MAG: DUF4405 domain-containing protein [Deltaproteobacteria bacterium]|jgi:hypothetical protein|nr:DUF4405 domain-containing protein [Deltaproteobacteria bacterium]